MITKKRIVWSLVLLVAVLGMWKCNQFARQADQETARERQEKRVRSFAVPAGSYHYAIWERGELLAPEKTWACDTMAGGRGVFYKDYQIGDYYVVEYLRPPEQYMGGCSEGQKILVPKELVTK